MVCSLTRRDKGVHLMQILFRKSMQAGSKLLTFPELLGLFSPQFYLIFIDQPVKQTDTNKHRLAEECSHMGSTAFQLSQAGTVQGNLILGFKTYWSVTLILDFPINDGIWPTLTELKQFEACKENISAGINPSGLKVVMFLFFSGIISGTWLRLAIGHIM